MARRKQAVAEPVEVSASTPDSTIEEEAPKEKEDESLQKFLDRLKQTLSFDGTLVWVDCDLPGYEGVRVAYNVDNDYSISQLFALRPEVGVDENDIFRLWSLFVRRIEWPFDIPAPHAEDISSYAVLVEQMKSFVFWMIQVGYVKAKRDKWGN
jgi:hypothetical protein